MSEYGVWRRVQKTKVSLTFHNFCGINEDRKSMLSTVRYSVFHFILQGISVIHYRLVRFRAMNLKMMGMGLSHINDLADVYQRIINLDKTLL